MKLNAWFSFVRMRLWVGKKRWAVGVFPTAHQAPRCEPATNLAARDAVADEGARGEAESAEEGGGRAAALAAVEAATRRRGVRHPGGAGAGRGGVEGRGHAGTRSPVMAAGEPGNRRGLVSLPRVVPASVRAVKPSARAGRAPFPIHARIPSARAGPVPPVRRAAQRLGSGCLPGGGSAPGCRS